MPELLECRLDKIWDKYRWRAFFTYRSKVVNLFTVAHEDSEAAARCLGAMIEKILVMYSDEYGRK